MMCDICGKKNARIRHITRSYGKGSKLLIIENIPAVRCPSCGETYLTADTLHEIERIKLNSKEIAVRRSVPVAAFA
ncbi:type II toxin-antitoxin system MqsA family antitoxin [Desulfococcaceae bacterium HSG8]|nr:type II toxin-antitoxin system MqsA family antitoxin [Desulfococcaceae bacterium HSG8]